MNRTNKWICDIPNDDNTQKVLETLKKKHGNLLLRGRHPNRSRVMKENGLKPNHCNDIPWRLSTTIAVYRRTNDTNK